MTTDTNLSQIERLADLMVINGLIVLFIGLVAGLMLVFSMLGEVALWPLPAWEIVVPGSVRGWAAAHSGGIMNGLLVAGAAFWLLRSSLMGGQARWAAWGMIITGWANTVFYWAGNLSANRGISVADTPYGEGEVFGAIAYLIGGSGMIFTFIAVTLLIMGTWRKMTSAR